VKWKKRLKRELAFHKEFEDLSIQEINERISQTKLLSDNYDTVCSLDLPHYCSGATSSCGGEQGWCYTFQGFQSLDNHLRKTSFLDFCIKFHLGSVVHKILGELSVLVDKKLIPYPNLRYSGSGELTAHHIPLLRKLSDNSIHVWGFTKNLDIAIELHKVGISVIFSYDKTSDLKMVNRAHLEGIPLAYTSEGVEDSPAFDTAVVFPLHRGGKVKEIVEHERLCPKVVEEFLGGKRQASSCQIHCTRCHKLG